MNEKENISLLFFGALSELTGKTKEQIPVHGNVGALTDLIRQKF